MDIHINGEGTESNKKKAEDAKWFLEWGFAASSSRQEIMSMLKEWLIAWTGYWEIWFVNHVEKIEYNKWTKRVTKELKEQYPFVKYVSCFNLFHDPTVSTMENSHFVCVRRLMTKRSFVKRYGRRIDWLKAKMVPAIKEPRYFSTYDYDKIKHSIFWSEETIWSFMNTQTVNDFDIWRKNYLSINYEDQYVEVIEYWESDRWVVLLNGHAIHDWGNPMPIKKIPFCNVSYSTVPWLAYGIWLWTSLNDIQHVWDEILNLTVDNIKLQIAPMFQKMKGWDMFDKKSNNTLNYEPFGVVETNTPNAISRLDLGTPDFSWVQFMQFLMQLWEMSEWMNAYSMWAQNKVERSATWVSSLVQASKARLLPMTESLNLALSKIAEMWISLAVTKMDDTINFRVTWPSGKVSFKELDVENIIWKYDIEFDAQSLKSASREIKRNQLNTLLQTAVSAGVEPNTQKYIIDIKKLWREIFEAYELPQDMVLSEKEVIKDITKDQLAMAKAQQKVQEQMWPPPGMPWMPWQPPVEWWSAPTEEPVPEEEVPTEEQSAVIQQALSY